MNKNFSVILILFISSCAHYQHDIEIGKVPAEDYVYKNLDNYIGNNVCVSGVVMSSVDGLNFPLQENENDGVLDISYSRIVITSKRSSYIKYESGKVYKVCGKIEEVFPFKSCGSNSCKWYVLKSE